MEQEPILHVWINHDHDLVDLTITTTTKGAHGKPATKTSEVIHTNQKHPFFTMEHGFLPVGQIKPGMHLLRADGRVGVVTGWKVVPGTRTMYNLEVAQDHTFTVGAGQWVVHNSDGPGCGGVNPRPGTPFKGDFERVYPTSQGPVTLLANAEVIDNTLILSDIAIYGVGEDPLTGLTSEMLQARSQLFKEIADMGFDQVEIRAVRGITSSSANPGKIISQIIDLARYKSP